MNDFLKNKIKNQVKGKPHAIHDAVLLGSWEELPGVNAQTIKPELAPETLDGLLLKGYEMKWGQTNENYEQYDKEAFDKFIQEYFVDRKLNMPVDINHQGLLEWQAYCGRVLYIETNSVGFYFAVYIPRTYRYYDDLRNMLQNGIIQGFSKEGYATDWSWHKDEYGNPDYEIIHEMKLISVSLVCTPANGVAFERMQEIKNALLYTNKLKDNASGSTLAAMFNK